MMPRAATGDREIAFSAATPKAHHVDGRFRNLGKFETSRGGNWGKLAFDPYRRGLEIPTDHALPQSVALEKLEQSKGRFGTITWIGHSTFLIRLGKLWILTDPVFSKYATPVPPFGPRRIAPPGIAIKDLPKIDVILISHNHYDHTDARSLSKLARRNPDARVFVPLKNSRVVKRSGFENITEADWFESNRYRGLKFTAVPAVHSSKRRFSDGNKSLWAGWSIDTGRQKIYFAGDTAAGSFINEIRRRLGFHKLAFVPIGAYQPPELEKGHHVTPEQAVALARSLGAHHVVPMHWGTFALTPEPVTEQKERFVAAMRRGTNPHVLRIGETIPMP